MDIKALTPHLSITPQVLVAELEAVAQMGFKAIICNRPDGEGPDQPSFKEMEQAALTLGMQMRYLPADAGKVSDADGKTFGELLATLPGPVLAYCRTGMRSTTLWTLSGTSAPGRFDTPQPVVSGSPNAKP